MSRSIIKHLIKNISHKDRKGLHKDRKGLHKDRKVQYIHYSLCVLCAFALRALREPILLIVNSTSFFPTNTYNPHFLFRNLKYKEPFLSLSFSTLENVL
jgi:hypothetical protein